MSAEYGGIVRCRRVPKAGRAVLGSRGDGAAVLAEGHAIYCGGMAVQDEHSLPAFGVPEPDGAVAAPRDQPAAVRAEGDAEHTALVAAQRVELFACQRIPHADRLVGAARGQSVPMAAVSHTPEIGGMPRQVYLGALPVEVEHVHP